MVVLTSPEDTTADLVVAELNERGVPVFRCDTADFPTAATMAAHLDDSTGAGWSGSLRFADREVVLSRVGAVYYRRPGEFTLPDTMSPAAQRFAAAQSRAGLLGVLASLECLWVNHPGRSGDANYKPRQLRIAGQAGLNPPRTLITNDPGTARAFTKEIGGPVVYKTLAGGALDDDGISKGMPTSIVDPDGLDDSIGLCAHQFQEWVDKDHEIRLTVVGDEFFAAQIHAHSDTAHIDWRNDYAALTYDITDVPPHVRGGVMELMQRFGLVFGALDFVVTPDGQWRFLEINPNGQWGWIQTVTGLPISTALADLLQKGHTS